MKIAFAVNFCWPTIGGCQTVIQKLAEKDKQYKKMLDKIGTSKSEKDNGLPSSSIGNVAKGFNLSNDNAHDSLADCLLLMDILTESFDLLSAHSDINIEEYQKICVESKTKI